MKLETVIARSRGKTVYRDGDNCIKLFDEGYSKADILNEATNQARIEETGLNIPCVREVMMIEGKWAIVSDYIPGKTLAALMAEHPEREEEYLSLFVDLQLSVLKKTSPRLSKLRDKMRDKISQTTLDATTRYELHARLEGMKRHSKLCHGDFNPTNVIIREDGTPFIVDWAHATQGNGAADAARTYLLFCLSEQEALGKQYLDVYCKKSDTARQYVQKWMPIVAASQSVKGNEHEREFLLSWCNVVDYE
jgi:tRNA A-37 threonylcarbamoyl transferase component Bud32